MKQNPKILHVEDDADIREIAKLALEMIGGLTVVQCETGAEAISAAPLHTPDLFLLDMSMPDMDGVETMQALQKLPGMQNTPAIFMTARAQTKEHEALVASGAVAVITKPFDAMTLADEIRAIWNSLD